MAVTKPYRRVVHASEVVEDALTKQDLAKPEIRTPDQVRKLTYEQRLQRQIDMLNAGMTKYERVLLRGGELDDVDQKNLLSLVDSGRKLELALAQIRAKADSEGTATDLELALQMIDKGFAVALVKANFNHNPGLAEELDGALSDRESKE